MHEELNIFYIATYWPDMKLVLRSIEKCADTDMSLIDGIWHCDIVTVYVYQAGNSQANTHLFYSIGIYIILLQLMVVAILRTYMVNKILSVDFLAICVLIEKIA
jgi:hypothetical protein